jgi:hypothetical protein
MSNVMRHQTPISPHRVMQHVPDQLAAPASTDRRWTPNDWMRLTALLGGLGLFCLGAWMLFQGIVAEGTVDLKSSVLSGTIKASSAGLYICFFSLFIIVFVLVTLLAPTRAEVTPGARSRASRLMPVFWGLLIALGVSVLAAALLPSGTAFGFSLAIGVLMATLSSVVFALLRMVNEDDA